MQRVDSMAELIKHPQASYMLRVRGKSMRDVGIFAGDVVLVDRTIAPRSDVVIAAVDASSFAKRSGRAPAE